MGTAAHAEARCCDDAEKKCIRDHFNPPGEKANLESVPSRN